jgi:aspartate/methionine/tyrosine aminotransferase
MRRIPAAGINLFQLIYVLIREYEQKSGQAPLNLSLGNPDGVPPKEILDLKARFAGNPGYDYHTYAEDKNLHSFAEHMVELHGGLKPWEHPHLRVLPTAGIKTASALIPLACGLHLPDARRRDGFSLASNLPAYDVVGTWTQSYLGTRRVVWPLRAEGDMRLEVPLLEEAVRAEGLSRVDAVFVIRPGNPAAVGASRKDWEELIAWCVRNKTRLVNDGAYAGLTSSAQHTPLAAVAKDHPELEWLELYSVSKSFNDPGARLGALVGSKDFVEDYVVIKGNTDSGPVPSVMAAYGEFFKDRAAAKAALDSLRGLYERRLAYVVPKLKEAGLRQACPTDAGFFTLWRVPKKVLGVDLQALAKKEGWTVHEAFNRLVISETGLVGVHFPGPFIRYAVCADVLAPAFQERFEKALRRLQPEYA